MRLIHPSIAKTGWLLVAASLAICIHANAQKVGIGSVAFTPVNRLDVKGNAVIGDTYSGVSTAPTNGLLIEGNTGIGTTSPSEKLDVSGNIRFSGALLPANLAGTAGQVLKSSGAGVAPVWGPQMGGITAVERWYLAPQTFNANTTYTFTVTGVTGCTVNSNIFIDLVGSWATQPNVTIHHVEAQSGQFKFRLTNNTLSTNYVGMDFNILVVR
jgi:hypothetical protein